VVAVVVAQASPGAVLAGLGDVGAQLVDRQADPAGGDPGDPLPGLGVRRAVVVGAEEGVDELCRARDYSDTVTGGRAEAGEQGVLGAPGRLEGRHSSSAISHF